LCEQDIIEHREPLGGVAVGCEDHRCAARALEEELVDVLTLLLVHGLEREVVEDEQVDGRQRGHDGIARVVEPALAQSLERLIGSCKLHVISVPARDVSEGAREERLADADGAEDAHVTTCFEKAQARELGEHALVERHLRGLVPELEPHGWIEPGLVGAVVGGGVVPPRDLVGEDHQEQILERHLLLVGQHEPLGKSRGDATEAQALECVHELGVDRRSRHQTPSFLLVRERVSNWSVGRRNRGSASCTTLPASSGRVGFAALLSILANRETSTTSNASALWQIASTRPSPNLSQSESSAYAWRILVHGSAPPRSRSAYSPTCVPFVAAFARRASTSRRAYAALCVG